MKSFIQHLTERNYQNRTIAFMENGSWAPTANKVMAGMLEGCKNITYAETSVTIKSAMNADTEAAIVKLAEELAR
jgi:flavorubredoxin